ncbi:CPBP family intramembrane glutamic endopeptidase [Teredinibacter sp. KSP-S5-2]|uniref:CPBP family intramembrane glutamic endopeptidase n=1 Tax=Teredinibacter sp. KSP-S5-2 TaxID=3034506 RepID=UPI002934780B|nr:CPBP family intramembrane glutamic endopeptidase [Teredinibacter sp. KSP-S5-2]WNO10465.1 CPBP family intramembrane metalloprotease [Teredinibacter sp. KSP-S5-2]
MMKSRLYATVGVLTLTTIFVFGALIPLVNALCLPLFGLGLGWLVVKTPETGWLEIVLWCAVVVLGFFIAIYRPEGFHYPIAWETSAMHEGGLPFTLHMNFSKLLGGILVIIWLLTVYSNNSIARPLHESILITAASVFVMLLIANVFFDVGWQPKISEGLGLFVLVNLGITVLSEEAFFRLLIQDRMTSFFSNPTIGMWVAGIFTSVLFAFAHSTTINKTWLLFFIAGAIYSAVFAYTQRFSMALAVHFGVNLMHFIFLRYPIST